MAKTWDYRGTNKKGSFSQKKKELQEYEDLASSGYLDEISNRGRMRIDKDLLEEEYD
tara:strand:- start:286 stop:456 length:171 start_codon:yes stop_codon:yes gene_type:complete